MNLIAMMLLGLVQPPQNRRRRRAARTRIEKLTRAWDWKNRIRLECKLGRDNR